MISVVCVYNDERVLGDVLLKSLRAQSVHFELIALDNTEGRFKSAAEALNHGGARASGDYIMFVHQDVWLASDSWLQDTERLLRSLPDLGVAGVAGVDGRGRTWRERFKWSFETFDAEPAWSEVGGVERPEEVQTLDECVLVVPPPVFEKHHFDEEVFDGWDSYGADYCLCLRGKAADLVRATAKLAEEALQQIGCTLTTSLWCHYTHSDSEF